MVRLSLDIIIINWNAGQQLRECLKSVAVARCDGFEISRVVVVDNASMDRSADSWDDIDLPLVVIRNTSNKGFAAACNQGAKGSQADYLLFLNPDARLLKNLLSKPVAFMEDERNKQIGIVGIQLVDERGEIARTCARFPTLKQFIIKILGLDLLFPNLFTSHFMIEWDHKNDRIVDHVIGAFFLVRRQLFDKLDGFDERFFVYLEDVDFSYRAKQLGYSSYYLTSAQACHKGGGSSEKVKDIRLFYSLRSRILYGYKHFNWISATLLALCTLTIELITRIIFAIIKGSFIDIVETLRAYKLLWSAIPRLILNGR